MEENLAVIHQRAVEIAQQAGLLLKSFFTRDKLERELKGENNMVTEADKASQDLIVTALERHFPDHDILAEEDCFNDRGRNRGIWIIDPLDGTTNFFHGFPVFCVSMAYCLNGSPLVGVVHDPMRQETFTAISGKGAFLNERPISVSSASTLSEALVGTGFPYDRRTSPKNNLDNFQRVIMGCHGIRRAGAAALDLCSIASGRLDAFWELKLKPWDLAAGALIIREAGGRVDSIVADSSGAGVLLTDLDLFNGDLVATNGNLSEELAAMLSIPQEIVAVAGDLGL